MVEVPASNRCTCQSATLCRASGLTSTAGTQRVMTVLVDICHREICRSSAVTSTNVAAPHAELDIIFLLASAVGHGHVTGSKFAMSLWPSKGCQGPSDS